MTDQPQPDPAINKSDLRCLAWIGPEPCPNDVVGAIDGVPLCEHHFEKSYVYDYPRVQNQATGGCR